ncbi:hypothetical protein LCGC14_1257900 [marine sediment metagenome]|uniref:Uncharacterized protein n=1 Tax=marine sediment metagenome TaxID=412755 RepID=A0A0F9LMW1_9ZZZZ
MIEFSLGLIIGLLIGLIKVERLRKQNKNVFNDLIFGLKSED